jgi:threonylcarbamoyladenosine tRNA methylthiotransferase MtaB
MIDFTLFQNKKAVYYTLGCKLNFAETSTIGKQLSEQGIREILPGEKADICIINTCSVTELADKKCRQAIRRIKKQHPDSFMVVTGCYAQLKPEDVALIEGVDLILGANQKMNILEHLEKKAGLRNTSLSDNNKISVSPVKDIRSFVHSCSKGDRTRYFLKVQDGCDYYCSFCTIPFARGRSRSGYIDELVALADNAGKEGGKEIVLTGVNTAGYNDGRYNFYHLLKTINNIRGKFMVRISSLEPFQINYKIIDILTKNKQR